jgi:8-oxo-dGTP diphosphatase
VSDNHDHELPPTTRVAAYAIALDEARQMLLVRIAPGYSDVGQWTLPGGGLNFGEEPTTGALRELEEETGLTGAIEDLAFVDSWTRGPLPERGWGAFHAIQIVYRVRVTGGSIRHEVDESTDMAAWIPLDEIRQLPIVDLVDSALQHLEASEVAVAD